MNIITEKNPILRQKAREIDFEQISKKDLLKLIKGMKETMAKADGIGLAAPQIGKSLRIFVIAENILDKNYYPTAFINPEIKKPSKETVLMEEGCLSVPGIYGIVERPRKIKIKAVNELGHKIEFKADLLLARVIQHEYDHLEGILFIDKAKELYKQNVNKI